VSASAKEDADLVAAMLAEMAPDEEEEDEHEHEHGDHEENGGGGQGQGRAEEESGTPPGTPPSMKSFAVPPPPPPPPSVSQVKLEQESMVLWGLQAQGETKQRQGERNDGWESRSFL
jgi:hypothetical protein